MHLRTNLRLFYRFFFLNQKKYVLIFSLTSLIIAAAELVFSAVISLLLIRMTGAIPNTGSILTLNMSFQMLLIYALIISIILASFRTLNLYVQGYLAFGVAGEITNQAAAANLSRPLAAIERYGAANLVDAILVKASTVSNGIFLPLLSAIPAALVVLTLAIYMLVIDAFSTSLVFLIIIFGYLVYSYSLRGRLRLISESIAMDSSRLVQRMLDCFGLVREIKTYSWEQGVLREIREVNTRVRAALRDAQFFTSVPRILIELFGVSAFIITLLISEFIGSEITGGTQNLFFLITGFFRILPYAHTLYVAWNNGKIGNASINDISSILTIPDDTEALDRVVRQVKKEGGLKRVFGYRQTPLIVIENLTFRHDAAGTPLYNNLTLALDLDGNICILGDSGSGKSTLVEIVLGLRGEEFCSGRIKYRVDGVSSMEAFLSVSAYVPQKVYVGDGGLIYNITGSHENGVDFDKLDTALYVSGIRESAFYSGGKIENSRLSLSGGEGQRLALARAVYRNPSFLFLDEINNNLPIGEVEKIFTRLHEAVPGISIVLITHDQRLQKFFRRSVKI